MGVARILRGWVRPGVDAGFLVRGDDGEAESPERGAKRRSDKGSGVLGLIFEILLSNLCIFYAFLRLSQTLNLMQHVLILEV